MTMPIAHTILTSMDITTGGIETRLPIMCALVEDGSSLMLFDTGFWGSDDLERALDRLGLLPRDVTHVFLTHFHGDHAGGIGLFPDAVKVAAKKECDFSRGWLRTFADAADRYAFVKENFPYLDDLIVRERSDMLAEHLAHVPQYWWDGAMDGYVWLEDGPKLPACIRALATPGHTPHHTSYLIAGDRGNLLVAGDAMSRRAGGGDASPLDEPHLDLAAYGKSLTLLQSIPALVVPAHDRPYVQGECPVRLGRRVEF
jgi:glyoxylase-like metal-dependent hydrolase (beta-lactamase superfamily II)